MIHAAVSRRAPLALVLALLASASGARAEDAPVVNAPIVLVPHTAIYDLSLGETRGNSQIAGVRGRILYDFSGNACEGYTLEFRQVSELDSGEGKTSTSDLRSTTWESADGKSFKFKSENYVDASLASAVDGSAARGVDATAVDLTKPETKHLDLAADVVFPTQHMVRAIAAGRVGKNLMNFAVYDGSETGDKVFDTLTVVGRKLGPNDRKHDDFAANEPKLAAVPRWPVTISYFERGKQAEANSSEQMPSYSIGFELYDNGISRALSLDYNDFVVTGKLTSLTFKEAKPCP